jgi:hypothetical protein
MSFDIDDDQDQNITYAYYSSGDFISFNSLLEALKHHFIHWQMNHDERMIGVDRRLPDAGWCRDPSDAPFHEVSSRGYKQLHVGKEK